MALVFHRGMSHVERVRSTYQGRCRCGDLTLWGSVSLATVGDMAYECERCYEDRVSMTMLTNLVVPKEEVS